MRRLKEMEDARQPKKREASPDYRPEDHAGQRSTRFIIPTLIQLCVVIGVVACASLLVASHLRGIGEAVPYHAVVPKNKLNKPVTALAVDSTSGYGDRLIAADKDTLHVGKNLKDLIHWRRRPIEAFESHLAGPKIVEIVPSKGNALFLSERDGRRGLSASTLPPDPEKMIPWNDLILDASFCPGLDNKNIRSVAVGPDNRERFVGADGIGVYEIDGRHWKKHPFGKDEQQKETRVNDIVPLPGRMLAIMSDEGVDLGRRTEGGWSIGNHFDTETGLIENCIKSGNFFPAAGSGDAGKGETEVAASLTGDLVYRTADLGLGRLRFAESPDRAEVRTLIAGGRAQGLNRKALHRVSEDRKAGNLWMVYKAPEEQNKYLAAVYEIPEHRMNGLPAEAAWIGSDKSTLAVDSFTDDASTAWIGDRGLLKLVLDDTKQLRLIDAGYKDRQFRELEATPTMLFCKTTDPDAEGPPIVLAGLKSDSALEVPQSFETFIGKRRFEGLRMEDITAAADGRIAHGAELHSALYLGTSGKGIGVFDRATRDFFRVFEEEFDQKRLPSGILDLSADGENLLLVGSDRSLHLFDQKKWTTVIPESGIDIRPEDVRTVVANGPYLAIGSRDKIGLYSAKTHRWRSIPPLPDLEHLIVAVDGLWGIDEKRKLWRYPGIDQTDGEWSRFLPEDDTAEAGKTVSEETVVDWYGDEDMFAWISEHNGIRRIRSVTGDGQWKGRALLTTDGIPGNSGLWTAAAVNGTQLFVAPHADRIGWYDLSNHRWKGAPVPKETAKETDGSVRKLIATVDGLWLLSGAGKLSYLPYGETRWQDAADDVRQVEYDETDVIALTDDGRVFVSKEGKPPMTMIVGDAMEGSADRLITADAVSREPVCLDARRGYPLRPQKASLGKDPIRRRRGRSSIRPKRTPPVRPHRHRKRISL